MNPAKFLTLVFWLLKGLFMFSLTSNKDKLILHRNHDHSSKLIHSLSNKNDDSYHGVIAVVFPQVDICLRVKQIA